MAAEKILNKDNIDTNHLLTNHLPSPNEFGKYRRNGNGKLVEKPFNNVANDFMNYLIRILSRRQR